MGGAGEAGSGSEGGALRGLETTCASLIQEKYDLQAKLRKMLNAAASEGRS
jgi:hypothetical protein